MRAKEFILTELADNPAPVMVSRNSTPNELYLSSPELELSILLKRNSSTEYFLSAGEKKYDHHVEIIFSVANEYDITGKGAGKKFRIFSTVNAALQKYLPKFIQPTDQAVYFTSDNLEESRLSLYSKLARRYVSAILGSGWNFYTYDKKYDRYYIWEREGVVNEDYEEQDYSNLPSIDDVKRMLPQIAAIAQKEYDSWDEEDRDTYAGGGICHLIADGIVSFFWDQKPEIPASTVSSSHEQHVYAVIQVQEGVYSVDIHHSTYETGGGFSWKKIPNVEFEPNDITLYKISGDPSEFESIIEPY